ncbi:uncharacterized protein L203_102416 [Cryptococcus depauperatus CBS 7841]|uniref:Securin n=1 Tax=Cryptococcus depauperatus CBS 7841 TaxID=1295531 RepID=A0AAJ8JRS2_9TREE
MLAPRTVHRAYGHPTTSKKNVNKENAHALPSKTPSRTSGKPQVAAPQSMRVGLGIKTEGRDHNMLQSQLGGGKGKVKEMDDIEPKRLFANVSKGNAPPSNSFPSMSSIPPLQARTPGPRRTALLPTLRTPAPSLRLLVNPAPTPLPSATRARRRSRQSLTSTNGSTPLKTEPEGKKQDFVTPAPIRWEEELSLGSVEVDHLEELEEVEEEEDGEPEYMPPPVQELPYNPGWEVPDFGELFGKLSSMPPMWGIGNETTEPPDLMFKEEIIRLKLCDDELLEEDYLRPKVKPISQPIKTQKTANVRQTGSGAITASRLAPVRPHTTIQRRTVAQSSFTRGVSSLPLAKSVKKPFTSKTSASQKINTQSQLLKKQPTHKGTVSKASSHEQIQGQDEIFFETWDEKAETVPFLELDLSNLDL